MDIPFNLAAYGYRADPGNPNRFIHPDGHPFYPVEFKNPETRYTMGDCIQAIAQAAYTRGSKQAEASVEPELRHCNTCGFQIAVNYGVTQPIEGFPQKGPKRVSGGDSLEPDSKGKLQKIPVATNPETVAQLLAVNPTPENIAAAFNVKPRCNKELSRAGGPVPRTCGICGLGPCARDNIGL